MARAKPVEHMHIHTHTHTCTHIGSVHSEHIWNICTYIHTHIHTYLQRTFRAERASAMARAKASSSVVGWPGTITVVEQRSEDGDGQYVLVDGQVRVRMYVWVCVYVCMCVCVCV
jgi:hypothetical protein